MSESTSYNNGACRSCEILKQQLELLKQFGRGAEEQQTMELASARTELRFMQTKLQSAESQSEQLRQELQRMRRVEDELSQRCRENDDTVQQVFVSTEKDRKCMKEEMQKLKSQSDAQMQTLAANARLLEQKSAQELQLTERIRDLTQRLDKIRRDEAASKRTSEQLKEYESIVSGLQDYTARIEAENLGLKQRLQESKRQQVEMTSTNEQLKARFVEELQRSAALDYELQDLKRDLAAKETQLARTRESLRQAEEAIQILKGRLHETTADSDRLRSERDKLKLTVTRQIGELLDVQGNSPESLQPGGIGGRR